MSTPSTVTTQIQGDFRERYNALLDDMKNYLFERNDEIHGIGLAGIGRLNMFNLGPPGLAKSLLPRLYTARIAGFGEDGFFDTQINRTTVPEQLFGPMSMKALDEDRFVRNPAKRLPVAKVALLDEFFKGSSAILDTGLKVLEEREWDNDGESQPVPLWFAICPSNECPTDTEFQAIRDRLPLSYISEAIKSDDLFVTMLQSAVERHRSPEPETFVTVEEIEEAQKEVKEVVVDDNVLEALSDLRRKLREDSILPSDRRMVKAVQVLQSHAYLAGRDTVTKEDFKILTYVLWQEEEQFRTVKRIVMDMASPMEKEALEVLELVQSMADEYDRAIRDAATHEEKVRHTLEAHAKVSDMSKRRDSVKEEAERKGLESDVIKDLDQQIKEIAKKLKDNFGLDSGGSDE